MCCPSSGCTWCWVHARRAQSRPVSWHSESGLQQNAPGSAGFNKGHNFAMSEQSSSSYTQTLAKWLEQSPAFVLGIYHDWLHIAQIRNLNI